MIGRDWQQSQLLQGRDAMTHRGPDDAGIVSLNTTGGFRLGLAHRRLSILDLSPAGHQPMEDPTTGNLVVFNGEIYNHLEVRRELPEREYFSTSDTETLLAAYAHWGRDSLQRLVGMFAFALWDKQRQELLLVRDRLGKKPLYYSCSGGQFTFASELKALLAAGFVSRRANPLGIESFLAFGAVQEPYTILQDAEILTPGEFLRVNAEGRVIERGVYWSLHSAFQETGKMPDLSLIKAGFFEAVEDRLISDVPLGAFLSGGIDSSAVVAAMSNGSASRVKTFCLDFSEGQYREGQFAEIVAEKFGTDHRNVLVKSGDLLARLDGAFAAMDQPTTDGINSYFVSDVARTSGVTVALSGQGGDEIFAGYPSFRFLPRLLRTRHIPAAILSGALQLMCGLNGRTPRLQKLIAFASSGQRDIYDAYAHQRGIFWDSIRSDLLLHPSGTRSSEWLRFAVLPEQLAPDTVNQVSQLELACYLRNMLLRDLDVFSMAHSLEVRAPMLDHRLVELMAGIAGKHKLGGESNKHLLVSALGNGLPDEVVHRPKDVFWFPWEQWLRQNLRKDLDTVFKCARDIFEGLGLCRTAVLSFWDRFGKSDPQVFWIQVWGLNVLLRWSAVNKVAL